MINSIEVDDEKYMRRCLQLAANGKGNVSPNPLVGAVVVYKDRIIGEGYHCKYGQPHAEVNAIRQVKDRELLRYSTLYVSLEPCSHYGKTPPCSQLIIDSHIPRVVIAMTDPYYQVSGRGIELLKNAGIEVKTGVLEKEARELNKEFLCAQIECRPYIYLKWAQTKDGFIDRIRNTDTSVEPAIISNDLTRMLVHKLRAEVDAIMVGTNTAIKDNPSLTTRYWYGKNPVRIVIDRCGRISPESFILDNQVTTWVFTEQVSEEKQAEKTTYIPIKFDENLLAGIIKELNKRKIHSLLVEGGKQLLESFVEQGLWDEAYIEIADKEFYAGITAPTLAGTWQGEQKNYGSYRFHFKK